MLPDDRKGMLIKEVSNNMDKLDYYIVDENKIDFDLKELSEIAGSAYNSSNSSKLNKNNKKISDSEYCKLKNISSYKKYIEKRIFAYKEAGKKTEQTFENITHNFKKQI